MLFENETIAHRRLPHEAKCVDYPHIYGLNMGKILRRALNTSLLSPAGALGSSCSEVLSLWRRPCGNSADGRRPRSRKIQAFLCLILQLSKVCVRMAEEKIIGEFNAIQSASERYAIGKPCVLFLTDSRMIVAEIQGLSSRVFVIPIVLFGLGFVGLLLREFLVLLIGVAAATVSSLFLIGINSGLRNQRLNRARKLSADEILRLSNSNFDIPYAKVAKIELERHEEYRGGGANIILPSLPEYRWIIDIWMRSEEDQERIFILKGNVMAEFKERIKQYVPEIIEHEPLERSIFERGD